MPILLHYHMLLKNLPDELNQYEKVLLTEMHCHLFVL